jgi:NADH-quinone oxidoreductase subunit H
MSDLLAFVVFPGFLFTAAVGMFLTWVDRRVSAVVQWRVGPPWFQPYADFVKLLLKETLIPDQAPRWLFLGAPIVSMLAPTGVMVMLWKMNFSPEVSFLGDLIVVLYLLALVPIAAIVGGSASRNPLSAVGASREMSLYFAYELPFLLSLLVPVIKAQGGIRIGQLVLAQLATRPFLYSVSGVIAFVVALICTQAKLGLVPFDAPEAEQEIMGGPYLEYSGVALAMFRLSRAMMYFVMPVFLLTMFWGGIASWLAIPKGLLIIVLVILIKNTNPRLRIEQALRFFWARLSIVGLVGLVLAAVGW